MAHKKFVMGLFPSDDKAADAISLLKKEGGTVVRVHSPIPSEKISRALKLKKSKIGWFTLAGGIFGFFSGFALAAFTATRWHLIVSGKPVVALVPFFIVGFEFTILFAVFGNVIGMLSQIKLPAWRETVPYDPRCSGDRYGVVVTCDPSQTEKFIKLFQHHGGEGMTYDTE